MPDLYVKITQNLSKLSYFGSSIDNLDGSITTFGFPWDENDITNKDQRLWLYNPITNSRYDFELQYDFPEGFFINEFPYNIKTDGDLIGIATVKNVRLLSNGNIVGGELTTDAYYLDASIGQAVVLNSPPEDAVDKSVSLGVETNVAENGTTYYPLGSLDYKPYFWIDLGQAGPTLTLTPQISSKTVSLVRDVNGNIEASPLRDSIHFTDTDFAARPTAQVNGKIISATDAKGRQFDFTSVEVAALKEAFRITEAMGSTNTGDIQWLYNAGGKTFDFITDKETVTFKASVEVTDAKNNLPPAHSSVSVTITGTQEGIDYRSGTSSDAFLPSDIANHFDFVGQYIGTGPSYLNKSKADADKAAGLQIFSIYEHKHMNEANYYTKAHGLTDGKNAYAAAKLDGQTAGSAIYFGIDFDPGRSASNLNSIVQYFKGIEKGFAAAAGGVEAYEVGVYGAGITLSTIKDVYGLADFTWLAEATAWTGSKAYTGWNIEQVADPRLTANHDAYFPDRFGPTKYMAIDKTNGHSFGAWY